MSWTDLYVFGIKVASMTGFDLIEGLNKATMILLLLICGLLASGVSFAKCSIGLRIAFVVLGLAVILFSISAMNDVTSYTNVPILGKNGTMTGVGLYLELFAGIILIGAAACRRTKDTQNETTVERESKRENITPVVTSSNSKQEPKAEQMPHETQRAEAVSYCRKCGEAVYDTNSKFCNVCGSELYEKAPETVQTGADD